MHSTTFGTLQLDVRNCEKRRGRYLKIEFWRWKKYLAIGQAVARNTEQLQLRPICPMITAPPVYHHVTFQLTQSTLERLHLAYFIIPVARRVCVTITVYELHTLQGLVT